MPVTGTDIWNFILRLYAALLAIYGVFLAVFFIYVTFIGGPEGQDRNYVLFIIVPFALVMFLVGFISTRKLSFNTIKLLTALTIFLLFSTFIEIFDLFIGPSFESETVSSAISMLLSLPLAFILYFTIVKLLSSVSLSRRDK